MESRAAPAPFVGLARGGALNLIGGISGALLTMALVLLVTRHLGTEEAGGFFAVIALFQILAVVGSLGVETGWVREISARLSTRSSLRLKSLMLIGLIPVVVFSIVLVWLSLGWGERAVEVLNTSSDSAHVGALLAASAPYLLPAALAAALLGATRGFGTMRPTVLLDRIGRPAVQLVVVWILLMTGSLTAVVTGWATAYVALAIAAAWWMAILAGRHTDSGMGSAQDWREDARRFWGFTAPRAAASIFRIGLQWLDVVLVALLASLEEVAVYTVATRILQLGTVLNQAVGQAVEPLFAREVARADTVQVQSLYDVSAVWLILLTWPTYLLVAAFADPLLGIFGSGYIQGVPVVVILTLSVLVGAVVGPVDILLLMTGKSQWSLWNTGLALAVNVVLDIWLIPVFGIVGAAIGWTVGRIVANVVPAWQLWRAFGYRSLTGTRLRASLVAFVTVGGVAVAVRALLGDHLVMALVAGLVGGGLFLVLIARDRDLFQLDPLLALIKRETPAPSR